MIDHNNTKVVLIGVSEYTSDKSLVPIPNVERNIIELRELLIDDNFIGVPPANVVTSVNETRSQILKKLLNIVNETAHRNYTLFVYYSGHGVLSPQDFHLYLTTPETSVDDLIDGIEIDVFKKIIKKSIAGRKILMLDCCHSGAVIDNTMDSKKNFMQASLRESEGTYIITSAAEYESALFPVDNPELPTNFTGKLLEIIKEGIDIEEEYCTFSDIYHCINADFLEKNWPTPQQSNYNNASKLIFCKNKKFSNESLSSIAWKKISGSHYISDYILFIEQFPNCDFINDANEKLQELKDEEEWIRAISQNDLLRFQVYLEKFPNGKFKEEAQSRITSLLENFNNTEESAWKLALVRDNIQAYAYFIYNFPEGKYFEEARKRKEYLTKKKLGDKEFDYLVNEIETGNRSRRMSTNTGSAVNTPINDPIVVEEIKTEPEISTASVQSAWLSRNYGWLLLIIIFLFFLIIGVFFN